jgi:hypothetical protein
MPGDPVHWLELIKLKDQDLLRQSSQKVFLFFYNKNDASDQNQVTVDATKEEKKMKRRFLITVIAVGLLTLFTLEACLIPALTD